MSSLQLSQCITNLSLLFGIVSKTLSSQPTNQSNFAELEQLLFLEFHLQAQVVELSRLSKYAENEPRIKGAFPKPPYDALIGSCQVVLDRLLSFRFANFKKPSVTFRNLIVPHLAEHSDHLIVSILVDMFVYSGSLGLKSSLPPNWKDSSKARNDLLDMIRTTPGALEAIVLNGDVHYIFIFFALKDIVKELETMRENLVLLFGEKKLELSLVNQNIVSHSRFSM